MSGTVLIVVTHLLGSGHLVRAAHLARALARGGFVVTLASGGVPLRSMQGEPFAFVQLPPVRIEGVDFRSLLDEEGRLVQPERLAARIATLEELAVRLRPDVVVTEHFPFGRRQLAGEFAAVISAARAANPQALVLSSVRDVLVTPKPARIVEAQARLARLFDAVLVHGEADFLPLDRSWPVTEALAAKLHYVGYLGAPLQRSLPDARSAGNPLPEGEGGVRGWPFDQKNSGSKLRQDLCPTGPAAYTSPLPLSLQERGLRASCNHADEILVSGGGSAAALPLFELALAAARLSLPGRIWRLLVGRAVDEADLARLTAMAPANAVVEWARPDFPALLAGCAVSVSQAGYNTVLDLVAAQRPAIVVPFDAGAETEQAVRAEALERAGLAICLRLSGAEPLTAERLLRAVAARIGSAVPAGRLSPDDGGRAVAVVKRLLAQRR